jgi:hypothetical protein
MATYFVEFYAEKKHRAMFVEYKAGVTEEYCQQNIRENVMKAYPDAKIHTIAKQIERTSPTHTSVQLKLEEAPF